MADETYNATRWLSDTDANTLHLAIERAGGSNDRIQIEAQSFDLMQYRGDDGLDRISVGLIAKTRAALQFLCDWGRLTLSAESAPLRLLAAQAPAGESAEFDSGLGWLVGIERFVIETGADPETDEITFEAILLQGLEYSTDEPGN